MSIFYWNKLIINKLYPIIITIPYMYPKYNIINDRWNYHNTPPNTYLLLSFHFALFWIIYWLLSTSFHQIHKVNTWIWDLNYPSSWKTQSDIFCMVSIVKRSPNLIINLIFQDTEFWCHVEESSLLISQRNKIYNS